ncbi:MAG: CRTAC1 family protein [Pirellulaceae bacterium]|nr:CRTAC1 family protein [Planctomycetales bacterium]
MSDQNRKPHATPSSLPTKAAAVLLAVAIIAAILTWNHLRQEPVSDPADPSGQTAGAAAAGGREQLNLILADQQRLDDTVWAHEQEATRHELPFVKLWDKQRRAPQRIVEHLRGLAAETIRLGDATAPQDLGDGISMSTLSKQPRTMTWQQFQDFVTNFVNDGWIVVQSEWHHERYEPSPDDHPISTINATIHAARPSSDGCCVSIEGPLVVTWSATTGSDGTPIPATIDATGLKLLRLDAPPTFQSAWQHPLETIRHSETYHDVLASDIDSDGRIDLIYPHANTMLLNQGDMQFAAQRIWQHPPDNIADALIADLTGDAHPDLVCTARLQPEQHWSIWLFEGLANGEFSSEPIELLRDTSVTLVSPDAMTAGDIDHDGDVDLFVTQYMAPYQDGRMATPYYDANDGHPCYLLINDGTGSLRDGTAASGLPETKRKRRTYRSSFVDLDGNHTLDLLVTSDFSGVDAYANDGHGKFTDRTAQWFDERANFGMSHCLADFNTDGYLDLYVTGMASTTARRLEALQLGREDFPKHQAMRPRMGYGNRLYYGEPGPRYQQRPTGNGAVRSGWSWGCTALDVENDGDQDIYVANGHRSGDSALDYCTRFWCHDIYADPSSQQGLEELFQLNGSYIGNKISWNGYEKNRLFLNRGEEGFTNASFLMGVAIEADSRSVLAEDLNNDGQVDLLVGWADRSPDGPPRLILQAFRNDYPHPGHWIGVRLANGPAANCLGTKVTVHTADQSATSVITTGDSFGAQHSATCHFGLGTQSAVTSLTITWPDGSSQHIDQPAIDQYHIVTK